jgi:N-acyl-D-aspartate/D-glutamate deacylase
MGGDRTRDVLVQGGLIVDGSGRKAFEADLLIRSGRIAEIGASLVPDSETDVIDASGCWVTPGFIDLHTHYEAEVEISPGLTESVRHGVTTVVLGSCGLSFAVGTPEDLADQFCRVEGVPRETVLPLLENVKDWEGPQGYLDHLASLPLGPNVAAMIGHSGIRAQVMGIGPSVDDSRVPTQSELAEMDGLLEDALEAGYLGMSFNTLPWDKLDGDRFRSRSMPSVYAKWSEYRVFTQRLRKWGAIFQIVPDLQHRWNVPIILAESTGLGRRPLKTMMISLVDAKSLRGLHRVGGAMLRIANRIFGADARMQSLPNVFDLYVDGLDVPVMEELGAGTSILHEIDADERAALLRDPEFRARFKRQWQNPFAGRAYHRKLDEPTIVGCPDQSVVGKTFAQVAKERGISSVDALLDLAADHGDRLRWYTVVGNDRPKELAWIVNHPDILVGFSDAGAHLRNMAFYNFPIRLLGLTLPGPDGSPPAISLERAVHRVSGEITSYLGLDAGLLNVGARADVVVVDPGGLDGSAEVMHEAEMEGFAGLRRLVRRNDRAVRNVIVSGRSAWEKAGPAPGFGTESGFGEVLTPVGRTRSRSLVGPVS